MNKKEYTLAELVERSVPYFASNPDVPELIGTTVGGKFFRPEFGSYADHHAAVHGGQVLVIYREALLVPAGLSYEDAMAEAGLVVPVDSTPAPTSLADVVASATHLPEFFNSTPATATEVQTEVATEVKPKRPYTKRTIKATATPTEKKASTKKTK